MAFEGTENLHVDVEHASGHYVGMAQDIPKVSLAIESHRLYPVAMAALAVHPHLECAPGSPPIEYSPDTGLTG